MLFSIMSSQTILQLLSENEDISLQILVGTESKLALLFTVYIDDISMQCETSVAQKMISSGVCSLDLDDWVCICVESCPLTRLYNMRLNLWVIDRHTCHNCICNEAVSHNLCNLGLFKKQSLMI